MVTFIATFEIYIGLDTLPLGEDKEGSFNVQYWNDKLMDKTPYLFRKWHRKVLVHHSIQQQ
jgi:hypothetical protein